MGAVDRPTEVRAGEELDVAALDRHLRERIDGLTGPPRVLQFPSGFSNLTYSIAYPERELVLRRPPRGAKPRSGHDMMREHTVLTALDGRFPYSPRPVLACDDPQVLGAPFYLMERLHGIVLRRDLPPTLELGADGLRAVCERLVDVHAELHALDPVAVGLGELGRPDGYVGRQVGGWSERFRRARTDDVPDGESVMARLAERAPADGPRAVIVHNDYKLDNVVLAADDPGTIVGVLDWEMATLGDPLMDLGCSLAYWVEASDPPQLQAIRTLPTHLPGALTRREVIDRYAERAGIAIDAFDFYHAFGLFRLAVIAQQIYYRFHHGQTRDPRFARLGAAVVILLDAAASALASADG